MTPMRFLRCLASDRIPMWVPLAIYAQTVAVAHGAESPTSVVTIQRPSVKSAPAPLVATTHLEGRLFFSPQERQRMDQIRKRGVAPSADGERQETPSSTLNGFVKRSDGQVTVWVDGQAKKNALSLKVRDLNPQDVGGSAEAINVLDSYPPENVSKRPMRPASAKEKISHRPFAKRSRKK